MQIPTTRAEGLSLNTEDPRGKKGRAARGTRSAPSHRINTKLTADTMDAVCDGPPLEDVKELIKTHEFDPDEWDTSVEDPTKSPLARVSRRSADRVRSRICFR